MLENAPNRSWSCAGGGSIPSSPAPGVPGIPDPATALIDCEFGFGEFGCEDAGVVCWVSKFNDVDSRICRKLTASIPFEAVGTICGQVGTRRDEVRIRRGRSPRGD